MERAQKTTKTYDIAELNRLYNESDTCDQDVFAEMRSNLLLISGEHYNRRQADLFKRIRESRELNEQQKLRLTKNHIQKITKTYVNNIISMAPGVGFEPKNESELADQKAAEMHHAVWQDANDKYNIQTELVDEWADDFVGIGEVAVKIFWDPTLGKPKAYHQAVDEEGNPLFYDHLGQISPNPIPGQEMPDYQNVAEYEGGFCWETLHGFNLLRAPEAKDMRQSPYLVSRKMVEVSKLIAQFGNGDEEIEKMFKSSVDETMVVFDANKVQYNKARGQCMVREFYFRPCPEFPRGYYFFTTKAGIFAQGELPGGIFPICYRHFDKIQTSPRGRSPVKIMRPYQAEINRSASKIAEHQVTLGDDKLLIQNGTKVSAGSQLPGIRSVNFTGAEPKVLPGRAGDQYLTTMQATIVELYQVMNVTEDSVEKEGQLDPNVMLFRAASQKKKFQRYIRGFERFLMDVAETYLALAKVHLPDDLVMRAVGKPEMVNIAEFKNSHDLCYEIKVKPQADDIETKMGKQLVMNTTLQYVGAKLEREDIGKILRNMPYSNLDGSFDDMTMDYDTATNVILALDRGEYPAIHQYDPHVYLVKRLAARMRQADFSFLAPQIQAAYEQRMQQHQMYEAQRLVQLQRAEQGYIPTDGYMVVCDLYVPAPTATNPKHTERVKIPSSSLQWLIKHIEAQGQSLEELGSMNEGAQAQIAGMVNSNSGQPTSPMDTGAGSSPWQQLHAANGSSAGGSERPMGGSMPKEMSGYGNSAGAAG